jgi:hypothetical protein
VLAGCSFEHGSVTRAPGDGRLIDTAVAIDAPDGSASDQIAFTNPLAGATPHTISLWINQRATTSNDCIISMGNGMMNQARWLHSRYNTATVATGFYSNDFTTADEDIIGDGWVHLA